MAELKFRKLTLLSLTISCRALRDVLLLPLSFSIRAKKPVSFFILAEKCSSTLENAEGSIMYRFIMYYSREHGPFTQQLRTLEANSLPHTMHIGL